MKKAYDQPGLVYLHSGAEACVADKPLQHIMRDYYQIVAVLDGRGSYTQGGKTHSVTSGHCFLIVPYDAVSYVQDSADPWHYCWLSFSGALATELLVKCGFIALGRNRRPVFPFPQPDFGRDMLELATGTDPAVELMGDALKSAQAHLLFADLVNAWQPAPVKSTPQKIVESAMREMEYNFSAPILIQEMAEHYSLDRSHFYRLFMEETGRSPQLYLRECRLANAKSMLRNSRMNVYEIAAACGYESPSAFTRMFKAETGMTPLAWRRAQT